MTTKYVVTDEQEKGFYDRVWELENRWRKNILEPERTLDGLQLLIENQGVSAKIVNEFLKLISGNESLVLDPVDGKEILADAKEIFTYIDSDFRNYNADEKEPTTKKTPMFVYEIVKDATFSQMFGSLSSGLDKLCLTQAQIKNFVKKYRNWLRADGYATFFLFESRGLFFVARMAVDSGGRLGVSVGRFEDSRVWRAGRRRRVVVPQLA